VKEDAMSTPEELVERPDRTKAQAAFRKWWSDNGIASMATEKNAWRFFRAGWHGSSEAAAALSARSRDAEPVAWARSDYKERLERSGISDISEYMDQEGSTIWDVPLYATPRSSSADIGPQPRTST
jgi:hypothetical protein